MKLHFFFLFFFIGITAYNQEIIIDDNVVMKKGIYKDFEEFKFNTPSFPFNYTLSTQKKVYGMPGAEEEHTVYIINISKPESKGIGNVFGFCDGERVYVNLNYPILTPETEFEIMQYVGLYSYFDQIVVNNSPANKGNVTSSNEIVTIAIEINKGDTITINDNSMRKILKNDSKILNCYNSKITLEDDEKLLEQFKQEDYNSDIKKKYLIIYSETNEEYEVYNRDKTLTLEDANLIIIKQAADTTDDAYYKRVLTRLKKDPAFIEVSREVKFYSDDSKKSVGIVAKHYLVGNEQYPCKIGIWKYYYENGVLKEETINDITGKKISSKEFDSEGK